MSIRKAAASMVATAALTLGALAATPSLAADSEGQKAETAPVADAKHSYPYRGKVLGKSIVYKRAAPTTRSKILGSAESGSIVRIQCKVIGQNVLGNDRWYRVPVHGGGHGYMSARYVRNLDQIPFCPR
jgi:hypothetical protein